MAEYRWFKLDDGREVFRKVDDYEPKRGALPVPYAISDHMEPVQSQLDGEYYDSKSKLRSTYRAAGVIEVGNDPARLRPKQRELPDRQGIRDSLKKAAQKTGLL